MLSYQLTLILCFQCLNMMFNLFQLFLPLCCSKDEMSSLKYIMLFLAFVLCAKTSPVDFFQDVEKPGKFSLKKKRSLSYNQNCMEILLVVLPLCYVAL